MSGKRSRRAIILAAILLITTLQSGVEGPAAVPVARAASFQVATDATTYALCGRIFPDPHAYWPSPAQAPGRSPFAKGNAGCAATDFLTYAQMVDGATFLESLFPEFVEFYRLEEDFADGDDCATSTDPGDYCSAGLPRQGVTTGRERTDLYMLRVTDERVADTDKRFFTFPLSIHGIERAGAEAGVRAAEDLATWAACEAGLAPATVQCAQEGAMPHALLETTPDDSVTAGDALASSAIYFVFANPDGWRRGDPDNLARFYQRYNGNGVDMNRDWPTIGYTFEPYTPWSEPETRAFGEVMKEIRGTWDGGIDLHGQLIDDAFSFTLLGASERDYPKNQRILQTVKGAWADAERRLAWSPAIKANDAPADAPGVYGVQWGTVWDTIDYTVTGSLGDWIDSPLGLGADGIDNEMSLSHLSNCGVGSCYLPDAEQLHVDGNKSLIYSMVNFTLLPEETAFAVPDGRVGYVFDPTVVSSDGAPTPPPSEGLPPQAPILNAALDATNGFTYEFEILGPSNDVYNGGVQGTATAVNAGAVSPGSAVSSLVLERYRPEEQDPGDDGDCTADDANWEEVNTYFNQAPTYLQAGQAVHGNLPLPGRWRICLSGGLASQFAGAGASMDLDIVFTSEQAWEDPGQLPYEVSNMAFFEDLAAHVAPAELVPVEVDGILDGSVSLDSFTSLVIADDPFPGFSEAPASGPAQDGATHANPGVGTVPCAYQEGITPVLPPTCVNDFTFEVSPEFNNQQLTVTLSTANAELNDWDLYVERFGQTTGDWSQMGKSTTATGNEQVTLLSPLVGQYRARLVNWSAADVTSAQTLQIAFSNEYAGPPIEPSTRSAEELATWAAALRGFAEAGGNLVLTDGAIRNLAHMEVVPRTVVNTFSVYAGFIGFTADGGQTNTYDDPLAANVDQPGAAEGPANRHQTYEPVPIGFAIQNADGADFNGSPVWSVDQLAWEAAGGRTAGTTTADQVTLGEIALGSGVVRIIGPLLPMPSEAYYHPFGLANYALTYSGYQVLNNALQWERPYPDLAITPADVSFSSSKVRGGDVVTITAAVGNIGDAGASNVPVVFEVDGSQLGAVQTIASIPPGGSGTASVTWDTKHAGGEHTVSVAADPGDVIRELDESNNVAIETVTVRGNKVRNSSFEQANDAGTGPDGWSGSSTSSGQAGWSEGGSDGERSATISGTGGSAALGGMATWTSDAIDVTAGEVLTLTAKVQVSGASSAPSVGLAYLGPTGTLLQQVTLLTAPLTADGFTLLEQNVTIPSGVAQVRVVLAGFAPTDLATGGTVTFDEIGLFGQ